MNPVSDEELNAFLDGELPEDARLRIAAAIATDESLAARLAVLESVDAALGTALPLKDRQRTPSIDAAIDRLVAAQAARSGTGRPDNVVPFVRPGEVRSVGAGPPPKPRPLYWSIAASLLLAVGAGLLWVAPSRSPDPALAFMPQASGPLPVGHPLAVTLSTTPAGTLREWPAGPSGQGTIYPVLSFRDGAGGLCREFELATTGSVVAGVACRRDGAWTVEAIAASAGRSAVAGGYVPASGDVPPVVAQAIERLMVGDALAADEEAAALRE